LPFQDAGRAACNGVELLAGKLNAHRAATPRSSTGAAPVLAVAAAPESAAALPPTVEGRRQRERVAVYLARVGQDDVRTDRALKGHRVPLDGPFGDLGLLLALRERSGELVAVHDEDERDRLRAAATLCLAHPRAGEVRLRER
jgi:hypothetical protein